MAEETQKLSDNQFVVRPRPGRASGAGLPALEDLGTVDGLPGESAGWMVSLSQHGGSAFDGWKLLQERVGDGFVVVSMLVDDAGGVRYPTGMLSLRFGHAASDQLLEQLSKQFDLELVGRTRFTQQQAMFRVAGDSPVFLPDLSSRIAALDDVESVWFDAESAYSRGTKR